MGIELANTRVPLFTLTDVTVFLFTDNVDMFFHAVFLKFTKAKFVVMADFVAFVFHFKSFFFLKFQKADNVHLSF